VSKRSKVIDDVVCGVQGEGAELWFQLQRPGPFGYPVISGDAPAGGAALAFLMSRPYNFRTLGGSADV
jgi:hypothetical protein